MPPRVLQALFVRHRPIAYDIQLALDAMGRARSVQLKPRGPTIPAAANTVSGALIWSPRLQLATVQDAHTIPAVLLGVKGTPYAGQAEVTERQATAAAAAAAAASAGLRDDPDAAAAAAAAAVQAAEHEQAAAAPESFFQKHVGWETGGTADAPVF